MIVTIKYYAIGSQYLYLFSALEVIVAFVMQLYYIAKRVLNKCNSFCAANLYDVRRVSRMTHSCPWPMLVVLTAEKDRHQRHEKSYGRGYTMIISSKTRLMSVNDREGREMLKTDG